MKSVTSQYGWSFSTHNLLSLGAHLGTVGDFHHHFPTTGMGLEITVWKLRFALSSLVDGKSARNAFGDMIDTAAPASTSKVTGFLFSISCT